MEGLCGCAGRRLCSEQWGAPNIHYCCGGGADVDLRHYRCRRRHLCKRLQDGGITVPTFITPLEVTPGVAAAFTDVDASAQVPAGATGVILHISGVSGIDIGLRKNGSTDS